MDARSDRLGGGNGPARHPDRRRPTRRSAVRTLAPAALVGVVVAVVLAAAVPPAGAQDGFRNGEAEASADTFTLNIKQGNANIGFTYGRAMSNYRDRTASAEARALDLGVLPTLFASEQCDGSTPPMNPDTLPPKTRVDSTQTDAEQARKVKAFMPGADGGPHGDLAGYQDARASAKPAARGLTESVDTDLFLIALDGGTTDVTAKLEGRVRVAHAVTRAKELRVFGGLFTFVEPRWEAIARSGAEEQTEASFTFERATVLGMPRSHAEAIADFRSFEWELEQLLYPLGVQFDLPTVEVADGRARVTPMAFRVVDPPFGADVLAPFFGAVQPQREAAVAKVVEEDCTAALAITLIDVILGIAAGSGSIEILAGGADAFTADTDFSSPPLQPLPALGFVDPAPLPPPAPLDTIAPVAPFEPTPEPVATPVTTVEPEVAGQREARVQEQAMPATPASRFEDTAAGSAAVAVGIAGLLGAFLLVVGERLLARRQTRRTP